MTGDSSPGVVEGDMLHADTMRWFVSMRYHNVVSYVIRHTALPSCNHHKIKSRWYSNWYRTTALM
jgi:hypothetical protein